MEKAGPPMLKVAIILGAGANVDFGYPTGNDLRRVITEGLIQGGAIFNALSPMHSAEELTRFHTRLVHADFDTIDQFVAALRSQTGIARLARKAIAVAISQCEHQHKLFGAGPHWYQRIVRFFRDHHHLLSPNQFRFYTFNYDRSLVHYFYSSLSAGGFPERVVRDFIDQGIYHLHGVIGPLSWQSSDPALSLSREYGVPMTPAHIEHAADNIITPDSELVLRHDILDWLLKPDITLIMGYGFHSPNNARIKLDDLLKRSNSRVIATKMGLPAITLDQLVTKGLRPSEGGCVDLIESQLNELRQMELGGAKR